MNTRKSILFISYYFPPVKVVGAVRLYHLSQEWMRRGVKVGVITCRNRRHFRQDEGMTPQVAAIRAVPAWDWRSLRLRWSGNTSPTVGAGLKKTVWGRWLARAQESFPFHFLLGDGGPVYLLTAYLAAGRYVREQGVTVLFTSYRPYIDHWVAYLLKLRFPHLYWVADFRDLRIDPVRHNVLWPRLQTWIDRRLLRRADLVTTVSEGLGVHLPVSSERRYVLRNAIAGALLERRAQPTARFTLTYTGSIYPGLQEPGPLFPVLSELLKERQIDPGHLQLRYLGKDGELWDQWMQTYELKPYSSNRGELDWAAILDQQCRSSINLLLSWSGPQLSGILTSKVYEYLSAGPPILTVINGPEDSELEAIVTKTGGGRVFYTESAQRDALKDFLLQCYHLWKQNGRVSANVRREALPPYTWTAQVDGLMAAMGR